MLEHLRQRIIQTLASVRTVALSTFGPAGLQASRYPCQSLGIELYLLVPRTSDHLFNLETKSEVVVVNEGWNMQGLAHVLPKSEYPANLALARSPETGLSEIVWIHPSRLTILREGTTSPAETIDVN
jgi:hypothetical protein